MAGVGKGQKSVSIFQSTGRNLYMGLTGDQCSKTKRCRKDLGSGIL